MSESVLDGALYPGLITAVMTTSPIQSHPSTEIVDKVIASIKYHLGDIEILLLADGVRVPEHENRRVAYENYKNAMRTRPYIRMISWDDCVQQAYMVRAAMPTVKTPLTLYIEHDYALTLDFIDWDGIINAIREGRTNCVRFHNLEEIHPLHQHLMLDCFQGADGYHGGTKVSDPPLVCGVPMIRTLQYWGCPHLMPTDWYREQMEDPRKFSAETYTEIEPAIYGHVVYAPWEDYKVMVYAPSEPSMRRSIHVSGRGHNDLDPKRDFHF